MIACLNHWHCDPAPCWRDNRVVPCKADRTKSCPECGAVPHITPETLTDEMIREERSRLLTGPGTSAALTGAVACNDALGRSHRRAAARKRICDAINARRSKP